MRSNDMQYGLCSLCLVRTIHISPQKAVIDLLTNAIANCAVSININTNDVLNSLIYAYYNNQLTPALTNWFNELIKEKQFNPDKSLRGFNGQNFDPVIERNELADAMMSYPAFENMCVQYYRFKQAMRALNVNSDLEVIINRAFDLQQIIDEYELKFGKDATFMIKVDTLLQFINEEKNSYEFIMLAAYAGIRSIIGKKDFCATTKAFIVMRLLGAKSNDALTEMLKNSALNNTYTIYSKRYHFDKLLSELQSHNFIMTKIGMTVGIRSRLFISCQLSYDVLPMAIASYLQNKKQKNITIQLKAQEKAAIEKVKQLISK